MPTATSTPNQASGQCPGGQHVKGQRSNSDQSGAKYMGSSAIATTRTTLSPPLKVPIPDTQDQAPRASRLQLERGMGSSMRRGAASNPGLPNRHRSIFAPPLGASPPPGAPPALLGLHRPHPDLCRHLDLHRLFSSTLDQGCSTRSSEPIACTDGTSNCTLTNAFGSFPDRAICRAAGAAYPRTEQELVAVVAAAAVAKRKVKVATRHAHSFTKLVCPGGGEGTIISTRWLNRTVRVDAERRLLTVDSGVVLRDLIEVAAAAGLSLPHAPYWSGVTIGGLLANGGKGGAVHEYVVGMRIVTPAPASQGFAVVRDLGEDHPDLDAAKVSLGVISQDTVHTRVTLELQPLFKRSVTFVTRNDTDLAEQRKVFYRKDDRVDVSTPGDGLNDYLFLRSYAKLGVIAARVADEWLEEKGGDLARCLMARLPTRKVEQEAFGFTGYPVVGFQHRIQAAGSCIDGDGVALPKAPAFVGDVLRLRDLNPRAFGGLDAKLGVLMRYVRASSAHLGKAEDSVDVEVIYYRSYTDGAPRKHAGVVDELEQMALRKYGGRPHWGKKRNFAFDGAIAKYPRAREFGVPRASGATKCWASSSTYPSIVGKGCAFEGLCVCSDDSHCAPGKGYFCRPGKVYKEARVCVFDGDGRRSHGAVDEL
ncbi:hypothetical protein SETIT_5G196300v2 [Setaria italica]|uniref:FAD-binding PCMH-type domain-containing protein n=1 Tax=Setaria italica TaxID=4555 RepID=A0A368R6K1_SETIT|nr:hypothetical protein SETIT_5G196300v2 [Setaria italica]